MADDQGSVEVDFDAIDKLVEEGKKGGAPAPKPPPAAPVQAQVEETPAKVEVSPEEGIDALKAQLASERARADAAEASRREADARANQASARAQGSDLGLVTNAIEMVKQQQGQLKNAYAAALQDGDFGAAAEVQAQMTSVAVKLSELEAGQRRLKEAPPPRVNSDPVEALCAQLTPQSATWVRSHPEFARDERQYRRMIAAHELAIASGCAPDSPAYFEAVEGSLGLRQPAGSVAVNVDDPTAGAAHAVGGRSASAPPSAPVSRATTPSGGSSRPNVIRLTPDQVEIAAASGLTVEEYAKNLRDLREEGKVN